MKHQNAISKIENQMGLVGNSLKSLKDTMTGGQVVSNMVGFSTNVGEG